MFTAAGESVTMQLKILLGSSKIGLFVIDTLWPLGYQTLKTFRVPE